MSLYRTYVEENFTTPDDWLWEAAARADADEDPFVALMDELMDEGDTFERVLETIRQEVYR